MLSEPIGDAAPLLEAEAAGSSSSHLWGVVLAGGEGVRLRPRARRICGDDRPKEYVPLLEKRRLLRQTLDRAAIRIPPDRTMVITLRSHTGYFAESSRGLRPPPLLVQPGDCGTAAAILLSAHWVSERDANAAMVVFPSDHFVLREATFMAHIARIAAWVAEHPERLVLLGAQATAAEVEYGWIELGKPLSSEGDRRIWEVRRFWEKPSHEQARRCLEVGCLWNTFVLVGKAATFLRMGQEAVPEVSDRLAHLAPFLGTEDEFLAMHQAYALMPKVSLAPTTTWTSLRPRTR
jgi:mannose-1-phosphate guanylyltransferase